MIDFNRRIENEAFESDDNDQWDEVSQEEQDKDLEMELDLRAMRMIRQHDYMHLFQLGIDAAAKLDAIINKKEYEYEYRLAGDIKETT